jgi:C4-dicarboxylate transporter DctM subunit
VGFIAKDLTVEKFFTAVRRTALMGAAIALSVGGGYVFTYIVGTTGVPTALTKMMVPLMKTPAIYLLILTIILFIAGCLLESIIIIILLAPILVPVGVELGIDPLHLGIAFCVNITIGAITPPFGSCLFTATRITDESYENVVKGVIPFMAIAMCTVVFITFCPPVTTFLPRLFGM